MTSPLQMVPDVEEGGREQGRMGAKKIHKEHKGKRNADKRETRGEKIGWRERLPGKRPEERERLQMRCFHAGLAKLCLQNSVPRFFFFFPAPAHFEGGENQNRGWKVKLHG